MLELTVFALFFIYMLSTITFMSELLKESRTWENTPWSKGSMLILILVGFVPMINTVLAVKAYAFRIKEEKLSETFYRHEEKVKNDNELN
tara:strand:- start:4 stop:273 length:270 start_codon:yes stop_codon:yes gene_type:complete